ncbi:hypothetical protein [Sphingomonas sp.]|uniref:hypothetical protein n=1 Tax=Sphingomonas sp. TaxID=28214 RepID=UPI003CC61675
MPNNTKWIVLVVIAAVVGAVLGPAMLYALPGGVGLAIAGLMFLGVVGYLVYILAGNRVGKAAPPALVAEARSFAPAPGMARLYVVRRGFMGGLAGMKVAIAGVVSGQIRMNQFVMAELPPGTYTLETAMARNGMKPSLASGAFTLAAGDIVVVRAMLEMRATHALTVQQPLAPPDGRAEIMAAKMVGWNEGAPPTLTTSRVVG